MGRDYSAKNILYWDDSEEEDDHIYPRAAPDVGAHWSDNVILRLGIRGDRSDRQEVHHFYLVIVHGRGNRKTLRYFARRSYNHTNINIFVDIKLSLHQIANNPSYPIKTLRIFQKVHYYTYCTIS